MEPADQLQHINAQVYLRQFEFKRGNMSGICTLKKGENTTKWTSIRGFQKFNNYFDLPTIQGIDPRIFEKLNGRLETYYPRIIKEIEEKGSLTGQNAADAKQFVANSMCRTDNFRSRVWGYFTSPLTKEKFLNEICAFVEEPAQVVIRNIDKMGPSDQLNLLMIFVMRHISHILMQFDHVILEAYENRGWATCDNPAIVEENRAYGAIISQETELYFPLSKKYCLYLHDRDAKIRGNKLGSHPNGAMIPATKKIHDMIMMRTAANAKEYVIFPWDISGTDLSKLPGQTNSVWTRLVSFFKRIFGK